MKKIVKYKYVILVVILLIIFVLGFFLIDINYVDKQIILRTHNVSRFDIVAIKYKDKKYSNFILFGLPGDTIKIVKGIPYVNSKDFKELFDRLYIIDLSDKENINSPLSIIRLSYQKYNALKAKTLVRPIILPQNFIDSSVYPHSSYIHWNLDNFGPFIVPKKNMVLKLNFYTYLLYKDLIERESKDELFYKNHHFFLGKKEINYYKFKKDYYFILNKNLNKCFDSRCFGPVEKKTIVGKVIIQF